MVAVDVARLPYHEHVRVDHGQVRRNGSVGLVRARHARVGHGSPQGGPQSPAQRVRNLDRGDRLKRRVGALHP